MLWEGKEEDRTYIDLKQAESGDAFSSSNSMFSFELHNVLQRKSFVPKRKNFPMERRMSILLYMAGTFCIV